MSNPLSFGEAYKSEAEAMKAVRNSILGLFLIIAIQAAIGLFVWYGSTLNSKAIFAGWPNLDGLILLVLAGILYYRFTRTAAVILVVFASFKLLTTWAMSGFGAPPGLPILITVATVQVAIAAFKVHEWEKNNQRLPRAKWSTSALVATTALMLVALVFPPIHLFRHIATKTSQVESGNALVYTDTADKYSISFPTTWQKVRPHDDYYGTVAVSPKTDANVRVEVERWSPWSIAPVALFQRDAFLKMAKDEAAAYSSESGATIEVVEMVGPENVNEARAIFNYPDGSKRYVYYLYNRAWSRQSSDAKYYFWRLTGEIPGNALQFEKEVEAILNSFRI